MLRHTARNTARAFSSTAIPATSVATLHELGVAAGDVYSDQKSLGAKDASSGEWIWTSYAERDERAQNLGRALAQKNIKRGDRIACVSKNRENLACTMYGAYAVGAAHVPLYEQQKPAEWKHVLEDSGAKLLFVATSELAEAARQVGEQRLDGVRIAVGHDHVPVPYFLGAPSPALAHGQLDALLPEPITTSLHGRLRL